MRICAVLVTRTLPSNMPTTSATCSPFEPDAPLFEQFDHALDVVRAAGDAGADQPAGGIHPELLVVDDGSGVELLGQVAGRELVGAVEALLVGQALVGGILHDVSDAASPALRPAPARSAVRRSSSCRAAPRRWPPRRCRASASADRSSQSRPWLSANRLALCEDLLVALAEGPVDLFRDRGDDDRLLVGVIADLDAEPAQLVGQDRLEVGAELLHPRVGQRPRVQRADPAVRRDHHVHQEIVDVHMRIAGDRRVEQVGLPAGPSCI